MKFAEKSLIVGAFLLVTHSLNALEPEVIYSFPNTPTGASNIAGASPQSGLAAAPDGILYGTTSKGGSNAYGTVFG